VVLFEQILPEAEADEGVGRGPGGRPTKRVGCPGEIRSLRPHAYAWRFSHGDGAGYRNRDESALGSYQLFSLPQAEFSAGRNELGSAFRVGKVDKSLI
jgi:hypothetical protein